MSLDFPNVSILGLNQEARFFDGGFNYSNIQKISVQGLIIDLPSIGGVTGIWSGNEGIINTVFNNNNFQDLTINGYDFGSGRIVGYKFSPGLDVQTKTFSADLLVYNSGNLFNLTGTYYNGLDLTNFQYLEGFNEDYNFTRKLNLGYSFSHSANLRFNSGLGQLLAIQESRNVAKTLFTGANLGFLFYSGLADTVGKRFYTEAYNLIDNSCSFNESFDFDDYNGGGTYSATRTNSFDLAENGVITIVENGIIKGIPFPTYQYALNALTGEMTGTIYRCSGIFNIYAPAGSNPFINSPISQGRSFDLFNNILTYTITFNNNPNNSGAYFWDYSTNVNRENGIMKVVEDGTILGKGENRETSFTNALNGWTGSATLGIGGIKQGLYGRASQFYIGAGPTGEDQGSTPFIETVRETYSPYKSKISYSYDMTNEQLLPGINGVKKIYAVVTNNPSAPLYRYNKINVFNVGEIAQQDMQPTLMFRDVTMTAIGERVTPLANYLPNFLNVTSTPSGLNIYQPQGEAYCLDVGFSFNPNENTLVAKATFMETNIVATPYVVPIINP